MNLYRIVRFVAIGSNAFLIMVRIPQAVSLARAVAFNHQMTVDAEIFGGLLAFVLMTFPAIAAIVALVWAESCVWSKTEQSN